MTPFPIAGVQMSVSATHENVTAMVSRIEHVMAVFPWVEMILFSELAPYGPLPSNCPESLAETEHTFQECAKRHGVWLIPGSMFVRESGRIYNEAIVINPDGEIAARYRKMFPFAPYERDVTGGPDVMVFDVPGVGRFGLSICYDIWFPETTRQLTSMGAEVLLLPVLTGTIDRDIELAIARATAAMFQTYVFDINGLGAGGIGQSCVIDPSGTVLYQAAGQPEIIPVEVDFDMVRRQRTVGLRGLGQTLKSFRDHRGNFPVYEDDQFDTAYLDSLGPLAMPKRGTAQGTNEPAPEEIAPLNEPSHENSHEPNHEHGIGNEAKLIDTASIHQINSNVGS